MHDLSAGLSPGRAARTRADPRPGAFHASAPALSGARADPWGRHVVRVVLGPQEWMMFAPPSSGVTAALMRPLAVSLASRHRRPAAGLLLGAGAGAGAAVLHAAGGETAIYAPGRHLAPAAAARISALAGQFGTVASGEVTVVRASHADLLPESLHPAVALATADACRIVVCERLVSPEAAEAIGLLLTTQARYQDAP